MAHKPSTPSSADLRALLDPYDTLVDAKDNGVAFTRVAATVLARRQWRYDAYVGVARHREEGGEVTAAWLELPSWVGAMRVDYRSARFYPGDANRIPRGVFPIEAPSALAYRGKRTLALGPLDPALFTWTTGRALEENDDEGIAVTLEDWLERTARSDASGEICLAKDIAHAVGVDVFISLSVNTKPKGVESYFVTISAPAGGASAIPEGRTIYQGLMDNLTVAGDKDDRDTLGGSLRAAFGLRADDPIWRE